VSHLIAEPAQALRIGAQLLITNAVVVKRNRPLRKTASVLSAFPMFVPSLSWQSVRFYI
jgi:hypothetical protein